MSKRDLRAIKLPLIKHNQFTAPRGAQNKTEMNKPNEINLNVEFASQALTEIPTGYIDKTVCGCGFTTIAIENPMQHTIIAVPSKGLIVNKVSQYNTKYDGRVPVTFELLGVDGDVKVEDVDQYFERCKLRGQALKIMVTYDSLWKVEHLLFTDKVTVPFHLVIDESNKLLTSASMKSDSKKNALSTDVITKVFEIAEKVKERVSFISATPIPISYMPNWVQEMPQWKYTWSGTIKTKPYLMKRSYPYQALSREIIAPLMCWGEVSVGDLNFKKVIVFVNSVYQIGKICRENSLSVDEVAVIVGDTVENDAKLDGYQRLTDPRKLPKYTFITSSGFEGIDLYDAEAVTVVVSNVGKKHQMIDLLTDLKQATSRQRIKSNPNYGKFVFIYNQTDFDEDETVLINRLDEWKSLIEESVAASKTMREETFNFLTQNNADFAAYTNYVNGAYVLNENLFNADRYFILEVRRQFKEGFDIRGAVDGIDVEKDEYLFCNVPRKEVEYADVAKFAKEEIHKMQLSESTRLYIKYDELDKEASMRKYYLEGIEWGELSMKSEWIQLIACTYVFLGKVWMNYTEAVDAYAAYMKGTSDSLKSLIAARFVVGKEYTRKEVKDTLKRIYDTVELKRTPKHTDMWEWFDIKEKKVMGERMIEILKRK